MADRAIEFCTDQATTYFSFANPEDRDAIYDKILKIAIECKSVEKNPIEGHTNKWISGLISNYEYLKWLNKYAERSLMDLAHYPVYPWVI